MLARLSSNDSTNQRASISLKPTLSFLNQEKRVDKQVSRMNYVENNNLDRLEKRLKSRRQEDYSDDYFESEEAMMSIKVSLSSYKISHLLLVFQYARNSGIPRYA